MQEFKRFLGKRLEKFAKLEENFYKRCLTILIFRRTIFEKEIAAKSENHG